MKSANSGGIVPFEVAEAMTASVSRRITVAMLFTTTVCIIIVGAVVLGSGGSNSDLKEYELDARTFGADALAKIERESGIDLPDGAEGLRFHHIPPVDPIVFAKIRIPDASRKQLEDQVAALASLQSKFPSDFANNRCSWWPTNFQERIVSKQTHRKSYYIETHLVLESRELILYLKYFTL